MVFQAPLESLQPPQFNPNPEFGEGTGSTPVTPGRGINLQMGDPSYTRMSTPGQGISLRVRDPSYAGASMLQGQ